MNRDERRALAAVSRRGFLNVSTGAVLGALAGAAPKPLAGSEKIAPT
ncbi:MAG: twin-arginine translocation signal domain-containing protein, partial [Acidobacteria bacterium]|nr:twin-arginine translocation signal domain-containing protein [Acidobacteriota bacterium]